MEDLVKSLEGSFHVTKEPNSTACPHPRFSQYKQKTTNSNQEGRRKQLLEIQKSNRLDYMNLVRRLTDKDYRDDDLDEEEDDPKESMDVEVSLKRPGRLYKDQLMLSEWLVEVPENFKTEWLTVLCPIAKRCLVVASRGQTRVYTKSGFCINSFPSDLPSGRRRARQARDGTILDCLYNEASRTFYILDIMCWNGHPVYDSETEFRFYWLHEKIREHPLLNAISKQNPFRFVPLPSFVCDESTLTGAIDAATFEIDGVLFYHKRSHYTFGSTPLVVWLKPYMVPEILGIPVPSHQMLNIPSDYTNYADHMKQINDYIHHLQFQEYLLEVEEKKKKSMAGQLKSSRKSKNNEMEVTHQGSEKEQKEGFEECSINAETVEANDNSVDM